MSLGKIPEHKSIRKPPLCEFSGQSTWEAVSVTERALTSESTDVGRNPSLASIGAV